MTNNGLGIQIDVIPSQDSPNYSGCDGIKHVFRYAHGEIAELVGGKFYIILERSSYVLDSLDEAEAFLYNEWVKPEVLGE